MKLARKRKNLPAPKDAENRKEEKKRQKKRVNISIPHKHLKALTPRHLLPRIPNLLQKLTQLLLLLNRALNPRQNLRHIAAVVAVVEKRDVEPRLQRMQELEQRAAALRELEHVQVLVGGGAAPADQVADVRLGELVVGQVRGGHAFGGEAREQVGQIGRARRGLELDADQDVGRRAAVVPVAELGHAHGVQGRDELGEGAGTLRDRDGEEGFFVLAHGGALGDEAEAVEVHVGAAGDGDEPAVRVGRRVARDPFFETGERQRARGLDDGPRVLEHVLDGCARLVRGDLDDFVDDFLADAEGFFAGGLDGRAVGEEAYVLEDYALAGLEGFDHGVCVVGFDADDAHVRRDALDVDAGAGDEAAAAHAAEDGLEVLQVRLPQQLHADGALAGDDIGVVEGRDGDEAVELLQPCGFRFGGVEVGAVEDDGAAESRDVLVLDVGGA